MNNLKKIFGFTLLVFCQITSMQVQFNSGNAFYEAALRGNEKDIIFLKENLPGYSVHGLKKVLQANKISKNVCIYVHAFEDYYSDDAYEPFNIVLKKFPEVTSQCITDYLKETIGSMIEKRNRCGYGTGEVPWLEEELKSLQNV